MGASMAYELKCVEDAHHAAMTMHAQGMTAANAERAELKAKYEAKLRSVRLEAREMHAALTGQLKAMHQQQTSSARDMEERLAQVEAEKQRERSFYRFHEPSPYPSA